VLLDADAAVGEYVYAQGGVLISKVPEAEALETLDFWKERFFELKKVDAKLAKVEKTEASGNVLGILQKANLKKELSKQDLRILLELKDPAELKLLYETANNIRQREHDNACCVHGIIEFSNYCRNNCFYCGIRRDSDVTRYRMTESEIVDVAKHAAQELGFKALVLQSGEDNWYTDDRIAGIVAEVRKLNVLIFLSVGLRTKEAYKRFYDAGARAALLRFETSNKQIFEKMRPGTTLEERVQRIKELKEMGYLVATGFLIGLPGETMEDRINNILLTKDLGTDMYSFGPLIPAKGTPLETETKVDKDEALKVIAVSRLLDRKSKILVTTALETLGKGARREGLLAGANSLMINVTPSRFRKMYTIYPGRPDKDKDILDNIKETTELLYSLGRAPTDIGL
jgi:biotin synthase